MYFAFRNYLPLGKGWSPSFELTWIPFTQGCIVQSLVQIGPVILEEIFKFRHVFSLLSPIGKGHDPSFLLHQRMLCVKFGWNWPKGSGGEDLFFLISSMYFRYFVIISPTRKRTGPFIWINWNPLHPRMLCASGSEEEDENVKCLQRQRRWTMEKFWSEKLTWTFGSGELKLW